MANPRLLKALSGGPVFVERAVPGIAYGKLAAILLLPIIKKKLKKNSLISFIVISFSVTMVTATYLMSD